MTAETDIAAVNDGGANTAAEVRTALTSVLDSIPEWLRRLAVPETTHANDDEFDDETVAANWVKVLPGSGTLTLTEQRSLLSVAVDNFSSSQLGAVVKPVTLTVGDIYEVAIQSLVTDNNSSGYLFTGLVLADGSTTTANMIAVEIWLADSQVGWVLADMRPGTFASPSSSQHQHAVGSKSAPIFLRIEYTAANTFKGYVSWDGVTWLTIGSVGTTLTPTHVGVLGSNWGTGSHYGDRVVSYDYIRKVG